MAARKLDSIIELYHRQCHAGKFPYPDLDHSSDNFRLLCISPRRPHEPLQMSLWSLSMSPAPQYTALSYAWAGHMGRRGQMIFEICINLHKFWVLENLYRFLYHYSISLAEPVLIWIDAICIDQDSVLERNHQVGLMRKIYSQATVVYTWLGSFYSARSLDYFHKLVQSTDWDDARALFVPVDRELCTRAHVRLADSSYFKRLWIIQEVLLAREAKACFEASAVSIWSSEQRYYTLGWKSWIGLVMPGRCLPPRVPAGARDKVWRRLAQHRLRRSDGPPSWRLWDLLIDYGPQQCSRTHDRIHGLVGLSRDYKSFPVDYQQAPILLLLMAAIDEGYFDVQMFDIGREGTKIVPPLPYESSDDRTKLLAVHLKPLAQDVVQPLAPLVGNEAFFASSCCYTMLGRYRASMISQPHVEAKDFTSAATGGAESIKQLVLHYVDRLIMASDIETNLILKATRRTVLLQCLTQSIVPDLLIWRGFDTAVVSGPALTMTRWLKAVDHLQRYKVRGVSDDYEELIKFLCDYSLLTRDEADQCRKMAESFARSRSIEWPHLAYPAVDHDGFSWRCELMKTHLSKHQPNEDGETRIKHLMDSSCSV